MSHFVKSLTVIKEDNGFVPGSCRVEGEWVCQNLVCLAGFSVQASCLILIGVLGAEYGMDLYI